MSEIAEPFVWGGLGERKSNGGTQWHLQDRIYCGDEAVSVTTSFNPWYLVDGEPLPELHERGGGCDFVSPKGVCPTLNTGYGTHPHYIIEDEKD